MWSYHLPKSRTFTAKAVHLATMYYLDWPSAKWYYHDCCILKKGFCSEYSAHKLEYFGPETLTVVRQYWITSLHVAQPVVNLFIDYAWETTHHPPYSSKLSPPDFDLFPKLKEPFLGTCFRSLDELLLVVTQEICHLNKELLLNGIQKLPDHWQVCIERGGDLLKGCK